MRGRIGPRNRFTGQAGFTLLEVLVAVGLLGILSLLMFEAISLTFKTREQIARVEELNHAARVALRKIVTDVSMAYLSNHVNRDEPASTTLFVGNEESLMFSYLGHERRRRGARESDQGVVEYRLGRDDDGRTIERREKAIPDTEPERGGRRKPWSVGSKSSGCSTGMTSRKTGRATGRPRWSRRSRTARPAIQASTRPS